jgi:hypothetical protein
VYYAKDPIYGFCFVKGPIFDEEGARDLEEFYKWKKTNGIHAFEFYLTYLYPDRWPGGVPLGCRNKCDRNKKYLFIVSKSLLDNDTETPKTIKKSSKLWPPTDIMASDKTWEPVEMWNKVPDEVKGEYVMAVLYKTFIGVADLADKNFCFYKGHIYSIDEDQKNRMFQNPIFKLPMGKRKLFLDYFLKNFDFYYITINMWSQLKDFNRPLLNFMEDIKEKIKNNFNFSPYYTSQTAPSDDPEEQDFNAERKKRSNASKAAKAVAEYNNKKIYEAILRGDYDAANKAAANQNDDDQQEIPKDGPFIGYRGTKSSHNHKHEALISAIHKYVRRGKEEMLTYVFAQLLSYLQVDQSKERKAKLTNFANRIVITTLEDMSTSPQMIRRAISCFDYIKAFNSINGNDAKTANPNPEYFIKFAHHAAISKRTRVPSGLSTLSRVFELMPETSMKNFDNPFFEKVMRCRTFCFKDGVANLELSEKFFSKCLKDKNADALVVFKYLYDKKSALVTGVNFLRTMSSLIGTSSILFEKAFEALKGKKEEFMLGGNLLFWYLVGFDEPSTLQTNQEKIDELKKIFTDNTKRELDDYVVNDRHVNSKFGMEKFVTEGSTFTNPSEIPEAIALRKLYEDTRLIDYTKEEMTEE